jgi:predicted amidohydrolase YtcJ
VSGYASRIVAGSIVAAAAVGAFLALRGDGVSGGSRPVPADLVLTGARVYTLDGSGAAPEGLASSGGRIVALGSVNELARLVGPNTREIGVKGGFVFPGFIDAHCHLASLGRLRRGLLDLNDLKSFEEALARVKQRLERVNPGAWVMGRGWDQADWGQKEFPHHEKLSAISPRNPVILYRVDGHAALVNREAMRIARLSKDTPNPPGGEVLKDSRGEPTGMLIDTAIGLVSRHAAVPRGRIRDYLLAGQEACLRAGLTGIHDAGISPLGVASYKKLCDAGLLKLRVYAMLDARTARGLIDRRRPLVGYGGGRFTLRGVKCYIDGALGSRGAWLLEPYADRPGHTGCAVEPALVREMAELCAKHGWQCAIHAIGDRANREVLDAYAAAVKKHPGADHRFRVEHAQVIHPEDIPRFAALGVIPSMQPTHATSDMRWARDRLGEKRLAGAYAWASLLKSGCRIAAGSDFPVESEKPLWGFYAAVTRQDHEGRPAGGWRPGERMTREQALRAFTFDAAYAAFEEKDKGTLEPGKLADFVVLDTDIMTCPPRDILKARVLMTVIGGEVVYRAE